MTPLEQFAVGLLLLGGTSPLWPGLRSLLWTPVDCVIDVFEILEDGYGYRVQVSYSFLYGDQRYVGKRFAYRSPKGSWEQCCARAEKYPEGSAAKAYVNPRNPLQSVLQPGIGVWEVIASLLFMTATGLALVFCLR